MPEQTIQQVSGWPFNAPADDAPPEYTARDARRLITAPAVPALPGRPLGARSGVRAGTGTVVTVTGTTVTVAPHSGVVDVGLSAVAGPYSYAVTEAVSITLDAAHATYPRVDLVGIRVDDDDESDGTGERRAVVAYLPGVPAVSPEPPGTPDRWMVLARVSVPASGVGDPAASEVWDPLPSPVWSVRTEADLPALAASLDGIPTALAQVHATGAMMVLVAGSWVELTAAQSSSAAVPLAAPWENYHYPHLTVAKIGRRVSLVGQVRVATGGSASGNASLGTIPPGYRPLTPVIFPAFVSSVTPARTTVGTEGSVTLAIPTAMAQGGWVTVQGEWWQ